MNRHEAVAIAASARPRIRPRNAMNLPMGRLLPPRPQMRRRRRCAKMERFSPGGRACP
jgi:hypothetical protein